MPHPDQPGIRRYEGLFKYNGNWLLASRADVLIAEIHNDVELLSQFLTLRSLQLIHAAPNTLEVQSWKETLKVVAELLQFCHFKDQLILLEYCPPDRNQYPTRVDVVICGLDTQQKVNAVLLELKAWTNLPMRPAKPGYLHVKIGGQWKYKSTPRKQVEAYRRHMMEVLKICDLPSDFMTFNVYAYLYNAISLSPERREILFGSPDAYDADSRTYTAKYRGALIKRLREHVGCGHGEMAFAALKKIQASAIAHYKNLPKRQSAFEKLLEEYDEFIKAETGTRRKHRGFFQSVMIIFKFLCLWLTGRLK